LSVWIEALKGLGLKRIEGRIIGDDDSVEEPRPQLAWAWDDLGYTSGAIFGALNLAENRMVVTISPGRSAGAPTAVDVEPHAEYRALRNIGVTGPPGSTQLVWPEQRPADPFLTIAGSIPLGAQPARLIVSAGNPTMWFASVLRNRLQREGIDVAGEAFDVDDAVPKPDRSASTLLYAYRSRPLAEIAQPLLKESINLYGEAAMRLNAAPGVFPTNDAAIEGMRERMDRWGIPREAWQIIDGSGLSRRNAIAPEALLAILQRMYDPSGSSPWMTGLPVAGRDGTLDGRMKGTAAENNVRAKTGTMSNIRSLAGYVRTRDGETLAFVIMVDNFEGAGSAAIEAIDRIAVSLASFSRR
jgi:PBP4 family serine-type D-alanyl-D-alanine carboxypeptidase